MLNDAGASTASVALRYSQQCVVLPTGDAEIFFHINNVIGDLEPLKGDRVEFEIRQSVRKPGSLEAVQVKLL